MEVMPLNAQTFLAWIQRNAARVTRYQRGGDGSGGGCDCIGLIIGAWRLSGNKWPWTHGSNYAARHLVRDLGRDQQLQPGDLVFKARAPGDSGYALPTAYIKGPDLLDYYHVGVVITADPLEIMHCTGVAGGIKRDKKRGKWLYSGQFRKITYPEASMETMTVWADSGKTVNLRRSPSISASLVCAVPVGAQVDVDSATGSWSHVRYQDKSGYMMSRFLIQPDPQPDAPAQAAADPIDRARQALYQARQAIDDALEQLSPAG